MRLIHINSIRVSILASLAGRLSSVVLAVLLTPYYISLLGIESYGIIGFYITLQAAVSFLEFGLSRACNRQLARLSSDIPNNTVEMRNLLRSLEFIYWLISVAIAVFLLLVNSWITNDWLGKASLHNQDTSFLIGVIALVIAFRWPVGLYVGALMGLQRQVLLNCLQLVFSVLNWVGSAAALYLINPNLTVFFLWQLAIAILMPFVYALVVWKKMPSHYAFPAISISALKTVAPFVMGLSVNTIIGTLLMQADKLILSGLLTLKDFGYYMLASTIVGLIPVIANSVANVAFPKFSQLVVAPSSSESLNRFYHTMSQTQTLLILPLALVITFFPYELLFAYLGDEVTAEKTSTILAILTMAKLFQSMLLIPYTVQLANGWLKLSNLVNITCLIMIGPALYFSIVNIGVLGAAVALLVMNLLCFLLIPVIMHKVILQGQWLKWLKEDFLKALAASLLFVTIIKTLMSGFDNSRIGSFVLLLVVWILITFLSAFNLSDVRTRIFERMNAPVFK